jgi:hypothetical protein
MVVRADEAHVRSSLKMPDRCIEMLLPLWSINFWAGSSSRSLASHLG